MSPPPPVARIFPMVRPSRGWKICLTTVTCLRTPEQHRPDGRFLCRRHGDDPSLLTFQTQAAQTVLQSREGPMMSRVAMLLGLMGVGMSGYSSRQLTLHCKPSANLLRWGKTQHLWPSTLKTTTWIRSITGAYPIPLDSTYTTRIISLCFLKRFCFSWVFCLLPLHLWFPPLWLKFGTNQVQILILKSLTLKIDTLRFYTCSYDHIRLSLHLKKSMFF